MNLSWYLLTLSLFFSTAAQEYQHLLTSDSSSIQDQDSVAITINEENQVKKKRNAACALLKRYMRNATATTLALGSSIGSAYLLPHSFVWFCLVFVAGSQMARIFSWQKPWITVLGLLLFWAVGSICDKLVAKYAKFNPELQSIAYAWAFECALATLKWMSVEPEHRQ